MVSQASFICLTMERGVNTSALSRVLYNCSSLLFKARGCIKLPFVPVTKSMEIGASGTNISPFDS